MNSIQWLEVLKSEPESTLVFRLPDGESVPGDYHITGVRAARYTGVDCGGDVSLQQETIVQLLAGRSGEPMSAGRAAAIWSRVLAGPVAQALDAQAEIVFEYDRGGEQLARYPLTAMRVHASNIEAQLGALHSVCAPARTKPDSGCCA